MRRPHVPRATGESGFTLVELMIATIVFSVVLLTVTLGILQITRVYYKGVTETNTQNTARNVMDAISQAIQFSGGDVAPTAAPAPGTTQAFCIGNTRYRYQLGNQLVDGTPGTNQTNHALMVDTFAGCNNGTIAGAWNGRELLGPHMRLSDLTISNVGTNLYKVTVRIVYGDDDLLVAPPTGPTTNCLGVQAGTQFCSISELSTIVVKRVQ